jgi:hypothetical protein
VAAKEWSEVRTKRFADAARAGRLRVWPRPDGESWRRMRKRSRQWRLRWGFGVVIDFWVGFCGAGNNHDKGEPRELAGEPNTAAVGCVAAWAMA